MYIIIVNKKAGSGKGLKLLHSIENLPLYKEYNCRSFITDYPGHAEKIAEQIARVHDRNLQAVIVIGGDGTFHEVINGLKLYPNVPVGFLPTGAGNDFARGINQKEKNEKTFQMMLNNMHPASYWTGLYLIGKRREKYKRNFVNSVGFGFDAEVTNHANFGNKKEKLVKYKLGFLVYVIGLFKALQTFTPYSIKLVLDGHPIKIDKAWMVVISNHPYFGGGMKINPLAEKNPNTFAVLVLKDLPKWKIITLFGLVFIGKHTFLKEVETYEAQEIELYGKTAIPFQVDGQTGLGSYCQVIKDKTPRKIFMG